MTGFSDLSWLVIQKKNGSNWVQIETEYNNDKYEYFPNYFRLNKVQLTKKKIDLYVFQ